jgi:molybdopterin/thiamine biosynthesis adenylyltransferase
MVIYQKIAIIGCGGINSWFVKHFSEMVKLFEKESIIVVKLFDGDIVEEKNLLRNNQNFLIDDLMENKAEVLAKRYGFEHDEVFITENNIKEKLLGYTDVILGVDNNKTRKLIYDYCLSNSLFLFDMRAQGTQIGYTVVDGKHDAQYYDKKFFSGNMERKGSCQIATDIEKDHIENGNKIIAFFGAYGIYLKRLRNETVVLKEFKVVY